MRHRRAISLLMIAGAWLIVGLFFFSQMYLLHPRTKQVYDSTHELVYELALSFIWACSTPLVVWLSNRFRIERQHWLRPVVSHLIAGVLIAFVQCALHGLILKAAFDSSSPLTISQLLPSFYFNIDKMLMVYWMIVFISHTYIYYQRFQERELKAAQLEAQLAQAQLQALRMQLHPHFLFNTLNAISSLMHIDVEAADRMMTRLSDLLRLTLESAGKQMVTLKEEIDFLKRYVEIEQIRFHDRLTVSIDISPDTLDAEVPTLILQPLVENAIKHGITPRASAGRVEVSARRENGSLLLRVNDNGMGFSKQRMPVFKEGLGISNTRSRLQKLYGSSHRFEISNGPSEGVVVEVSFPFQIAGDSHSDVVK